MKVILAVALVVAVSAAVDALQPRRMTRPVDVKHSWKEWQNIMASQPRSHRRVAPRADGGRIINGKPATAGQFPYQAAVIMDSSYFCGGSLISTSVILTAGHCVDGISSFDINLGTLSPDGGGSGSVSTTSRNSVLHQQYNANSINNDIGLVRLSSPVQLNSNIALIQLASGSNTYEGDVATVSGWGRTSDSSSGISSTLQYVDLLVISNSECAGTYGNVITSTKLCTTGNPRGSTCNGDSGGPLVINGAQIGIVSFGASAGCELGYPAAFTRVTSYLDWINNNQ